VRQFKFVDRTFNLNAKVGAWILDFFLKRLDERLFLHFELIPDHLPEALEERIVRFPPGALQFEIGGPPTTCCVPTCWTSRPCGGWNVSPATGI
jgi:hypothetical protein